MIVSPSLHRRHRAGRIAPKAGVALTCASLAAAVLPTRTVQAQLQPQQRYVGIDRPIPVRVEIPAGAEGPAAIHLLEPATARVLEQAPVEAGPNDLAQLFTSIWSASSPKLVYAQLVVGDRKIGPALVLQPMLTPRYARRDPSGRAVFDPLPAERVVYSGLRVYVDQHVVLDTTAGEIEVRLRPEWAPNTAWNFLQLVEGGFYTDVAFHRIVPGFVVQGGDPTGQGSGGPGYMIDLEPSQLPHDFGVLSMARSGDPNSNGSQFFICLDRERVRHLDGQYTAFGEAVRGAEVIEQLGAWELIPGTDKPRDPPVLRRAWTVAAPPYGEGPPPVTRPEPAPLPR